MKSVLYINKGKIWLDGRAYDWTSETLPQVFVSIRNDQKINEVRIVLGSDLSYVVDFRLSDASKATRYEVYKMTKGWLPFVVTDECFDWKMFNLSDGDIWAQVIAVEPSDLEVITAAIVKSNIKVEWMIPVGIVLGMESLDKETPTLIKWKSKEEISVLAQKGLVDYVGKDNDEVINNYAKQKWHLEVNPEQILLSDDNFKFNDEVFLGKNKGSDQEVLGLNLLKRKIVNLDTVVPKSLENILAGGVATEEQVEAKDHERKSPVSIWLIVLLVVSALIMMAVLFGSMGANNAKQPIPIVSPQPTTVITPTDNVVTEISPVTTSVDLSKYKVQVLNGSGVSGEAARLKDLLLLAGFVTVDTGNSPTAETQTIVSYKSGFPDSAVIKVMDVLGSYQIGNVLNLTSDNQYDVTIVIGSSMKI